VLGVSAIKARLKHAGCIEGGHRSREYGRGHGSLLSGNDPPAAAEADPMRLGTAELVLPRGVAAPTALERSRRSGVRGPAHRSLRRWPTSIEPQDKHTVFGGEVRMASPRGCQTAFASPSTTCHLSTPIHRQKPIKRAVTYQLLCKKFT
jgi:hypothetical protein